jgi:hypothetical protein
VVVASRAQDRMEGLNMMAGGGEVGRYGKMRRLVGEREETLFLCLQRPQRTQLRIIAY